MDFPIQERYLRSGTLKIPFVRGLLAESNFNGAIIVKQLIH